MSSELNPASSSSSSSTVIKSSNIGFQMMKKQGWKEGTGLGVSLQGRVEPVETRLKNNKRGLGHPSSSSSIPHPTPPPPPPEKTSKKEKAESKRMKKMGDEERRWQEKEFERSFFREFWPDNV